MKTATAKFSAKNTSLSPDVLIKIASNSHAVIPANATDIVNAMLAAKTLGGVTYERITQEYGAHPTFVIFIGDAIKTARKNMRKGAK